MGGSPLLTPIQRRRGRRCEIRRSALGVVVEEPGPRRSPEPAGAHEATQRRGGAVALLAVLVAQRLAAPSSTWSSPIASAHANGPRGWLSPSTIPVSMSCAPPTPSPSANADSLITWQTILPSTSPGASPTQLTCLPSASKNRSARAAASGDELSLRVSSTSPACCSGGSTWKPDRAATRVEGAQRSRRAQQQARSPLRLNGSPAIGLAGRRGSARPPAAAVARRSRRSAPAARRRWGRGASAPHSRPAPRRRAARRRARPRRRSPRRPRHDRACPPRAAVGPRAGSEERLDSAARLGGSPVAAVVVVAAPALATVQARRRHSGPRSATGASVARRSSARRSSWRPRSPYRRPPGPSARTDPCESRPPSGRCGRSSRCRRSAPAEGAAPRVRTGGCSG